MSKKNSNELPLETSTEVAMTSPNVSQNINLNLNQNNVIDIAIETEVERIETEMELVAVEIADVAKLNSDLMVNMGIVISKEILKDNLDYIKAVKACKSLGLEVKFTNGNIGYDNECLGYFCNQTIEQCERYKEPLTGYKRNQLNYRQAIYSIKITKCQPGFIAESVSKELRLSFGLGKSVDVAEKFKTKIETEYNKNAQKLLSLYQEQARLTMKYLEFRYGEKRIKAKIVKESLKKSPEGRGILNMLQMATNVKLL